MANTEPDQRWYDMRTTEEVVEQDDNYEDEDGGTVYVTPDDELDDEYNVEHYRDSAYSD